MTTRPGGPRHRKEGPTTMTLFGYKPTEIRKFLVALAGFAVTVAVTILAVGPELIPASVLPWVQIGIAVASSYGVFAVRNGTGVRFTSRPGAAVSKGDVNPDLGVDPSDAGETLVDGVIWFCGFLLIVWVALGVALLLIR